MGAKSESRTSAKILQGNAANTHPNSYTRAVKNVPRITITAFFSRHFLCDSRAVNRLLRDGDFIINHGQKNILIEIG